MAKVSAGRLRAETARPDPAAVGWLIHGPEPTETDDLCGQLSEGLIARAGPGAELTRLDPAEIRRDPARLGDSLRAGSLFGGRPVVVVEGAGEGLAAAVADAVDGLNDGDGLLLVTAGQLGAGSRLRKLFEDAAALRALAAYPQPLGRADIDQMLRDAGLGTGIEPAALDQLQALARDLAPSELRGLMRSLALYLLDSPRPVTTADIEALQPGALEGEVDAVVDAVTARRPDAAVASLARARTGGVAPATLAMALGRRFRQLHALAAAPDGPGAAIGRLRPPVFGPRRDALLREARDWPGSAIEAALHSVFEAELLLRSTGGPPDAAVVERLVMRLAMLRGR